MKYRDRPSSWYSPDDDYSPGIITFDTEGAAVTPAAYDLTAQEIAELIEHSVFPGTVFDIGAATVAEDFGDGKPKSDIVNVAGHWGIEEGDPARVIEALSGIADPKVTITVRFPSNVELAPDERSVDVRADLDVSINGDAPITIEVTGRFDMSAKAEALVDKWQRPRGD